MRDELSSEKREKAKEKEREREKDREKERERESRYCMGLTMYIMNNT